MFTSEGGDTKTLGFTQTYKLLKKLDQNFERKALLFGGVR